MEGRALAAVGGLFGEGNQQPIVIFHSLITGPPVFAPCRVVVVQREGMEHQTKLNRPTRETERAELQVYVGQQGNKYDNITQMW